VKLGAERGLAIPSAVVGEDCESVEQRCHALIVPLGRSGSLPLLHSGRPERRERSRQLGAAPRSQRVRRLLSRGSGGAAERGKSPERVPIQSGF
jgi:hypothetical protein